MTRLLALLAASVLLVGCGTAEPEILVATDPADPTTGPAEATATAPVWPPVDCAEMSSGTADFAEDAVGAATREEALLAGVPGAVSVERAAKTEPHVPRLWVLLDGSGTPILARGVFHTQNGWLVDTEERCTKSAD